MDEGSNILDLWVVLSDGDLDWGVTLHGGLGAERRSLDSRRSAGSAEVLKSGSSGYCGDASGVASEAESGGGGGAEGAVDRRHDFASIEYNILSIEE